LTKKTQAELLLFATTFIWSGTFIVVKWGLGDISPFLLNAFRFSIAALLFFIPFSRHILQIDRHTLCKGTYLGLLLFLGFATQTLGLEYTTASNSAFITGMMVIFTPFFQVLIEKRMPQPTHLMGVVIVLVGLWLLTSPSGAGFNPGDGLTLLCAMIFGLYIVTLDIVSKEHDILHLTFVQFLASAALGWLCTGVFEVPYFRPTANLLWALTYLSILATLLTTYVQTRFQRDTTPTRAVLIFTIEPVWVAILGALLLQERLGLLGMVGGGLIIAGILISELSNSQQSGSCK
jgi:drug/metabolite transporter (DMT)-like permease